MNSIIFFCKRGAKLIAKQIPVPQTLESRYDNLIESNPSLISLTAVDEEEIIDVVKGCKNKPSTDHDGIKLYKK